MTPDGAYPDQLMSMVQRGREEWGEAFTTTVTLYQDGDMVIEVHHVVGTSDGDATLYEELKWHSGHAEPGEAYRRSSVSTDPDAARNETVQDELTGEWVEL